MNDYILRIKLLLKDKTAMICYLLSVCIIIVVIMSLNLHAQERSSIPIGLVVEDDSLEAQLLSEQIEGIEALYVYKDSFESLYDLMLDGYINCIFIVDENYGNRVKAGETAELLEVYSAGDNKISTVVEDIIAGCMLYEICVDKTYIRYNKLEAQEGIDKLTYSQYLEYADGLYQDDFYSFNFDVSYVKAGNGQIEDRDISNGMIYRQMIAGMLSMLIMLIVFCSCNTVASEFDNGIRKRLSTVCKSKVGSALQENFAMFTYLIPLIAIIVIVYYKEIGIEGTIRLLLLNVVFALACILFFYICSIAIKGLFAYQIIGTFSIVLFGVMGFISVFESLLGKTFFYLTPVAVYIREFIKIGG